jgi:hypothetical protein
LKTTPGCSLFVNDQVRVMSFHSYVLKTKRHTILVDGCVGNGKERPARPMWHRQEVPYLERLAAAGVRPEQVDIVFCTHLHADHVGWNTRLKDGRWVPTFPNAKYIFWAARVCCWEGAGGGRNAEPRLFHRQRAFCRSWKPGRLFWLQATTDRGRHPPRGDLRPHAGNRHCVRRPPAVSFRRRDTPVQLLDHCHRASVLMPSV